MWPDEVKGESVGISTRLSNAPLADLVAGVSGRIAEFEPDVEITHSSYGDYGHPDHAAVSNAVQIAVRNHSELEQSAVRLYLLEWPRWVVQLNARLMRVGGRDIRRMGEDGRFNLTTALGVETGQSVVIDVAGYLAVRRSASRWYSAEIARGPLPMRLLERAPVWMQKFFLGKARLKRVDGFGAYETPSNDWL